MLSTNPYFNFNGNTEVAMNFYKSVFGGEFTNFKRFKEVFGTDTLPADEQEKIMNITLSVKDVFTLMATDTLKSMEQNATFGSVFHINLVAESEAEADDLFTLLSENGKVEMPMNKTFWGSYFGVCKDQFGVSWMINYYNPQN
ncbi:MAG: VOC family protein [Dyadobacter sp.]|uniref:VOC family protein n=1 Tax=Dyadobacter sp. TaxID=1914288 RepID=UPI003265A2DC